MIIFFYFWFSHQCSFFLFITNEIEKKFTFSSLTLKTLALQLSVYMYKSFRIKQIPLILFNTCVPVGTFYFLKFRPIWHNVSSDIICILFLYSRHFTLIERWVLTDTVSYMTSGMIYFLFYEVWPFFFFIFVSRNAFTCCSFYIPPKTSFLLFWFIFIYLHMWAQIFSFLNFQISWSLIIFFY